MKTLIPALAIVAYTILSAFPLFQSWWIYPSEQFSWLAFIIWLAPLAITHTRHPSIPLLCIAVLATLLGTLGSLNMLKYIGFACALASFVPWSWALPFWLLSAIVWMPVFNVLASHYFLSLGLLFKLTIPLLTSTMLCLSKEKTS